jgi:ribosomal protein S3
MFYCRKAKELIGQIMSKNQPTSVTNNATFTDGQNVVEIMIPGNRAGLIIGKGGETIKQLQVGFSHASWAFLTITHEQDILRQFLKILST